LHSIYHKHITKNIEYTIILGGNPNGRKPHNDFLYTSEDYNHRKPQLPKISITNWKEEPTPYL
jgi:hypothetical protein